MEDLPPTQTQESIIESQELRVSWARLISCDERFASIDVFKKCFTLGRESSCDITTNLSNISKNHFILSKDEDSGFAYLKDLSKNGTFVNGTIIGKGKQFLLGSDDIISLGDVKLKAFIFRYNQLYEDTQFLPPQLKKKYFVGEFLGRGGCGEVRLVYDKQTSIQYAVKRIFKSRQSSVHRLNHPQKIQTEIKILSSLHHEYIIDLVDICETDNEFYLVLEYMKGGELRKRICSQCPLLESEVKFIFYQIVLGVQYLHEMNVTHRDLKPENILLATNSRYPLVKITDFGLSKIMDEISLMETICGTMNYVAPEVIIKTMRYDQQVDVWSLGVILFQMLGQYLPFQSSDNESLVKKILRGQIYWDLSKWKRISFKAQDLVKKLLVNNPRRRLKVHEILEHPWLSEDLAMQLKVKSLRRKRLGDFDIYDEFEPAAQRCRYSVTL